MRHPRNKRERFLIGKHKGKKRAKGLISSSDYSNNLFSKWYQNTCQALRNTTKLCSCMMCGNPRRKLHEKTLQEKRFDKI